MFASRQTKAATVSWFMVIVVIVAGLSVTLQAQNISSPDVAPRKSSLGVEAVTALMVDSVNIGGPADKASLRHGDIILRFDGKQINSLDEVDDIIKLNPSGKIHLTIIVTENDKYVSKDVIAIPAQPGNMLGITGYFCMFVQKALPGTPAEQAGIRIGDVILSIDDVPFKSIVDFLSFTRKEPGNKGVFQVLRKDGTAMQKYNVAIVSGPLSNK